jgi:hypothetical protein
MGQAGQRRIIDVVKGLSLVRYVAADDAKQPPTVRITVESGSYEHVDLITHPDTEDGELWRPGACLVVLARQPSKLGVEVEPSQRYGSRAAKVNIEPLMQGDVPREHEGDEASHGGAELKLLGHVAGIGDVRVNAGEWVAGPKAPSRIEGIAIECVDKPDSLRIAYSVKAARPLPSSGQVMDLGAFAGTRGQAMPLTFLMFELSGPQASRYQFVVEALFLGSPITRTTGPKVELSGPTGREPLVGLRVALEETQSVVQALPKRSSTSARSGGRIRVFRSSSKQAQSGG